MIIIGMILVICIFVFLIKLSNNKILFTKIKMDIIEEKLNNTLIKRCELLKDAEEITKKILNTDKDIFENKIEMNNTNMIELDSRLSINVNEFNLIKEKYKKLQKDDEITKLSFAINETTDKLIAYKDYYNNIAKEYNLLINKFPNNIISIIKKNKQKQFFDKEYI